MSTRPLKTSLLQCMRQECQDILENGEENAIFNDMLRNMFSISQAIQNIVDFYPLRANCVNGHPIMKNYGWMAFSGPFRKSKFEKSFELGDGTSSESAINVDNANLYQSPTGSQPLL